ncbi:MAG: IS110 family transposase [Thaumarchaeota archaeon]|nr:IS110 family transposase [Nitrososphaerota archaeon]
MDIKRFSTPWKIVSYAGLAPSKRDSGDVHRNGRITKQGSRWLRYAIEESCNITIQHDYMIGNFYSRIASRRGPQKAKIAAAKEMLVIIWYMLTNREPYRTENHAMTEQKYKRIERHSHNTA